ncbi:MAG: DUF3037 domain-containing protein [Lysobacterales bacterium]
MSTLQAYSYVVLRYVHDTTTGEFVNVGVALHAPESRFLAAQCRTTYGRLSKVFPSVNADHFKSLMRFIQGQFLSMGARMQSELSLDAGCDVLSFAQSVLPKDDSSLQWSSVGVGRTSDPAATVAKLYERMVTRHDDRPGRERRDDDEVWRNFKHTLEARNVMRVLTPHTIAADVDQWEFKHTWKNGVLHCLEPVSFDLASAESIRDKARHWLGRLSAIADSRERFRVHFLVGEPQDPELHRAYETALTILNKAEVQREIVRERDAEAFAQRFAAEIEKHEADVN